MKPYQVKNLEEVCKLNTDNYDTKGYWILTDGYRITICEQRVGEKPTQQIDVPRTQFNRMIDWYLRDQKVKQS